MFANRPLPVLISVSEAKLHPVYHPFWGYAPAILSIGEDETNISPITLADIAFAGFNTEVCFHAFAFIFTGGAYGII